MTFERVLSAFLVTAVLSWCTTAGADGVHGLSTAERATMDRWLVTQRKATPSPVSADPAVAAPPIEQLLGGLEARLAADPADASGWALLAQTYAWLGRMPDARQAAERAVALGVDAAALDRKLTAAHVERARVD